MARMAAGRGLTRIDIPERGSHGYLVRLSRRGRSYSRFFADRSYLGKRPAKKAAQEQYREWLDKLGGAAAPCLSSRNSSGVVGVYVASTLGASQAGSAYRAYCASWISDRGKREKIAFSWKRYGKTVAFEMACHARRYRTRDRASIIKAVAKKRKRQQASRRSATASRSSRPR